MNRYLTLFLVVFLSSCQWWQDIEVLRVEGLSDVALSLDGMEGEVQVVLRNPNGFDIQAHGVDVAIYAGEDRIGSVSLPGRQVLSARSESTLILNLQSDPGALKSLLQNQLLQFIGGSPVEIRAEGTVRGRAFGLNVTFPIESSEEIKL
ncbi:MAG: LEA type 2 family protein [Bacteroidetes bacterium]|nr:LEA type 2 family protein [Bacteroidota bacterium]